MEISLLEPFYCLKDNKIPKINQTEKKKMEVKVYGDILVLSRGICDILKGTPNTPLSQTKMKLYNTLSRCPQGRLNVDGRSPMFKQHKITILTHRKQKKNRLEE